MFNIFNPTDYNKKAIKLVNLVSPQYRNAAVVNAVNMSGKNK